MWSTLSVDITPGQSSVRLSQDRPTHRYYIALYHTYVLGTTGLIVSDHSEAKKREEKKCGKSPRFFLFF